MAPRNTKGKNFMLEQLYEAENVPEDLRHTDDFINLSVNQILKRIDIAKKAAKPPAVKEEEDDDRPYRPWTAF